MTDAKKKRTKRSKAVMQQVRDAEILARVTDEELQRASELANRYLKGAASFTEKFSWQVLGALARGKAIANAVQAFDNGRTTIRDYGEVLNNG